MGRLKKTDYREMTFTDLAKAAHSSQDAWRALERFNQLTEAGKHPVIQYSQFNGWRVRDPYDLP